MDPMMRTLLRRGYDVEWHIVVLGKVAGAPRYRALATATGGSFLAVDGAFDEESKEAAGLLDAVWQSDEAARRARQRHYELDAGAGRAAKFDWYRALPPPERSD